MKFTEVSESVFTFSTSHFDYFIIDTHFNTDFKHIIDMFYCCYSSAPYCLDFYCPRLDNTHFFYIFAPHLSHLFAFFQQLFLILFLSSSNLISNLSLQPVEAHITYSDTCSIHTYIRTYVHPRDQILIFDIFLIIIEMAGPKKSSGTKKTASKATATGTANAARKAKVNSTSKVGKATTSNRGRPAKGSTKPKVILNQRATDALNVYVFGSGDSGVLGLGPRCSTDDVLRPRLNPNLAASSVGVVQVATGGMHCVALTNDNRILTWGVNDHGALGRDTQWSGGWKEMDGKGGDGDDSDESEPELNPKESTPTAVDDSGFPAGTVFTQVAAGDNITLALTEEGLVYGWGTFKVTAFSMFVLNFLKSH